MNRGHCCAGAARGQAVRSAFMVDSAHIVVEELARPATPPQPLRQASTRTRSYTLALIAAIPLLLVALIFAGYFVVYLTYARALFAFPFDYDQGEGFELYDAIRLARGEGIYLDNAQFPFYSGNYPPVYRLMLAPFIWLFGPSLWVGRAVAFACSLVIGVLIFVAARRLWRVERGGWSATSHLHPPLSTLIPLLAALAFFAANYVYHVGPLARAHLSMVMFAFAGILCLDAAFDARRTTKDDGRPWSFIRRPSSLAALGVTLLLLAGFTKLQAVDALVAGFGYLLIRKPKWFAVALVVSASVTGVIVFVMNAASAGQFWLNVISANVNDYDIAITWKTYAQWFQLQGVLIVCSVIFVIWDLIAAVKARSFRPITIWSMYFVAASAMGMLTGKWGAGPTYLIAAIAASCVCMVGLLGRVGNWLSVIGNGRIANYQLPITVALATGLFFWQALLNVHLPTSGRVFGAIAGIIGVADEPSSYPPYPYYDSVGYTQLGHLLDPADAANGWELVNVIRAVEGPVWSEEAMLTLLAGKDVVTNPTQLFNLSKNGMLDTSRMIEMIERREFGAIIFRALFYPDDVKEAIGRNYYWARNVRMNGFDYWVLLPNGGSDN